MIRLSDLHTRVPSPLVGEGGAERSEAPGEGYLANSEENQQPLTRLAAFGSSAPSPTSKSDVSDLDQSYMAKPGNTRVWRERERAFAAQASQQGERERAFAARASRVVEIQFNRSMI